jgi:hypothetical protein
VGYQPWDQIPLKASLGSYFFAPDKIKNVVGGVAELEYWLDRHFKLLVSYNYDNVRHSIGSIGLGIELGGARRERTVPQCIQERITDPVERNLAQQGQGSGVISQNTNYFVGPYPLKRYQYDEANHGGGGGPNPGEPDPEPPTEPPPPPPPPGEIASLTYFSNTGSPNDGSPWTENSGRCTVESPCGPNDFTQANVDAINNALPGASLYFSQGDYTAHGINTTVPMTLHEGQGVYGRTSDYSSPAPAIARPIFTGWLTLASNNTVSDIVVIYPAGNSNTTSAGINLALNATNILIQDSQIGDQPDPNTWPGTGISSDGGGGPPLNNRAVIERMNIFAGNLGISVGGPSLIIRDSHVHAGGGVEQTQ